MKISVTLPSLHKDCLERTIYRIANATAEHKVEILVATPFPVPDYCIGKLVSVVWVEDAQCSGCVHAHKIASLAATGDFITAFADDHSYVHGWDEITVENFQRRERAFRSEFYRDNPARISSPGPFSLGLRQITDTPHVGTMFGTYYPYFPFMRLREVKAIGGWYDATRYTNGFSDPDLGFRVWASGGRCEWADAQTITVWPEDSARRGAPDYLQDAKVFLGLWRDTFGTGWSTDFVRQWDLDVPIDMFPADARTSTQDMNVKKFARDVDWG